MNHKSQLAKNTLIIAIGKLSTQVISYLLLPLYSSKLDPSEYGIYEFICTVSFFAVPLITMQMEESMFRFLVDCKTDEEKKKVISQTIFYIGVASLISIPIMILLLSLSKLEYTPRFVMVVILFILSNVVLYMSNAMVRGQGKFKLYSVANVILGIMTILLNLFFILVVKTQAEGLLCANLIANWAVAIFLLAKLKLPKFIGKFDKKTMKTMFKYSAPLVPNSISWSIINMSDGIILTKLISTAANGIYGMANRFPNIINVFYSYFYTAWKESAAKIVKEDNKEKFYNSIYADIKRLLFAVTICLIAVMPFAFPIFINAKYEESYMYIPIIMVAMFFSNLSSFYGGIFGAYKETKVMGYTTMIAAAINLLIDLGLVFKLEVFAACLSTLVADMFVYFFRKYKLKKFFKLKETRMIGPIIVAIIILFTYYLKYWTGIQGVAYWIVSAVTLIFAIGYSYLINRTIINNTAKQLIGKIRKRKE